MRQCIIAGPDASLVECTRLFIMSLNSTEEILEDIRAGRMVILME